MIEVEHELDLDANNEYATKLHLAVKDNNLRYVQRLIGDGVHVQSVDKFGRTPLHWALVFGYHKVAYALIINTPKIGLEHKDNYGCTPLHYAALGGRTDVGRVLLERGALINSTDSKERTPLHYAAQNAKPDMVEMLVSRGANKNCLDYKGFLPCDLALEWGSFSSLVCLRQNQLLESEKTSELNDVQKVDCSKVVIHSLPNEAMSSGTKITGEDECSISKPNSPSLDKLMLAWKNIQNNAKRKRDLEAKWIAKAFSGLEHKLEQWREAEKEAKLMKHYGWSMLHNESSHSPWEIEGSQEMRSCQQIYRNRIVQLNCGESTSNFEASTPPQDPINLLFLSSSPSFSSSPASTLPLTSPTPNDLLDLDFLKPKLDIFASPNIETSGSSTPVMEVCQTNATSCFKQNVACDQKSFLCTPMHNSSFVLPCSSMSLTNSGSPSLISDGVLNEQDRFWWCRESNSTNRISTAKNPEEEATNSSNVEQKSSDLRWCTEWGFELPEISLSAREASQRHDREEQGSSPLNVCQKNSLVDEGKGKASAFFQEEPMWVQVWPKPTSAASSFASRSKTMTSI